MDKMDFSIIAKKTTKFEFQECNIEILPYIPQNVKLNVAANYIASMFDGEGLVQNYYTSEWLIIMSILGECTNINVTQENFDAIIDSGLWDEVKSKIINYAQFREELKYIYKIVSDNLALEKSFGQALDKITNKVIGFIDKISEIDLSQEGVASLVQTLNSTVQDFQTKFPTSEVKVPAKKRESKKIEE
jgi:hypothetical protein